ncbi:hypothetical protein BXZ70DRAFT_964247 [Cristinia sonorae]|uniref:Hydrophobin n=1 Tax=Cristinia sonorae TaxID=1940300 RepID=A0A8K0XJG1_9AGAR|nr:hypothetical protein BXZ70DRAFT_964247 [Cristinia sonorae]
MSYKLATATAVAFFAMGALAAPDALAARQIACVPCVSGVTATLPIIGALPAVPVPDMICPPLGLACTGGAPTTSSVGLTLPGIGPLPGVSLSLDLVSRICA